jgi:5-methylcytosine-specific restriction protein A
MPAEEAYQVARQVLEGRLARRVGIELLSTQHGIGRGSAPIMIDALKRLLDGERFTFGLSLADMEIYLANIQRDYDRSFMRNALTSLQRHIEYIERVKGQERGSWKSMRAIALRYEAFAEQPQTLEELNDDFEERLRRSLNDSPEERARRLKEAPKKPLRRTTTTTTYLRNADVVAEVLVRAQGECEGCKKEAPFAKKKDGTPYLEVHHVITLADGGEDTVENAIALCPNCHRRRHFGRPELIPSDSAQTNS